MMRRAIARGSRRIMGRAMPTAAQVSSMRMGSRAAAQRIAPIGSTRARVMRGNVRPRGALPANPRSQYPVMTRGRAVTAGVVGGGLGINAMVGPRHRSGRSGQLPRQF